MEICRSSVFLFIIVVCIMGIPTHAQTGTAATETTLATETTPAGTENTEGGTLTGVTSDATVATEVTTAGPTGTPGTPTMETTPGEATGTATTGTDAPTETPGTDATTATRTTPPTSATKTTPSTSATGATPSIPATRTTPPTSVTRTTPPTSATGANPSTPATGTTPSTSATGTTPSTSATRTTPPTPATKTIPPTPATRTTPPTPATKTIPPTPATRTTPPTPATRITPPTPATRTPEPPTKLPTKAPGNETEPTIETPPPTKFEGDMKILQIDGVEAVFKPDYEKPESILYRNLSGKVCIAVNAALENSDAGNIKGCSVSSFRNGSIVATFLMEFPPETKDISAELTTTLQEAFASSDDERITALTVDTSSITVKEIVPNTEPPSEPTTKPPPPKEFEGDLEILKIDGVDAVFSPDYEKPDSILYKNLSDKVCIAVDAALENSDAGSNMERCSVSSFRKGSIVATFLMEFPSETKVIAEELTESLKEAFNNSDDERITALTVDTSSITVKENFPITVPPKEDPGLSPGAIAGIAVGCVAAAAIIVVIIVLVVKKTGRSAKVEDVEEQELTRPSSRGDSPPPRGDSPPPRGDSPPPDQASHASDKSS